MHANPVVVVGTGPGAVHFGNHLPLALIAGPCAMESRDHALETARALQDICARIGMPLIYKSSFDKANRTSPGGARGLGMSRGLEVILTAISLAKLIGYELGWFMPPHP